MARPIGQGAITKNKIADKATYLFEQKGYAATSIEDVRKFAGISKGSIYTHFESKDDLYLYTLELSFKRWKDIWENEISVLSTAKSKLFSLAEYYASDMHNGLERTIPEYMASVGEEEFKEKTSWLLREEYEVFKNIVVEGIEKKEFKTMDAEDVSLSLYSMITNLKISKYLTSDRSKLQGLYSRTMDIFLKGILNE
jgi:AcrR family transcriptional regulator